QLDCTAAVLIIASALCVGDPRERPAEARATADLSHQRFRDERSDFVSYLNIWGQYRYQSRQRDRKALREWCRKRFLSHARLEEWREVHLQLSMMLRDLGAEGRPAAAASRRHAATQRKDAAGSRSERRDDDAGGRDTRTDEQEHAPSMASGVAYDYARVHRALLAGLLRQIGHRTTEKSYTGLRDVLFQLSRGSGQYHRLPKWVVAAEFVETERRYAHCVGAVRTKWIERAAHGLIRRTYFDAHWDQRRAEAMVFEQSALYGLVLNPRRRVRYAPIDRAGAREVMIRAGLMEGGLHSPAPFLEHNRELVRSLREMEARMRRPELLRDDQALYDFYDARIPDNVVDGKSFEGWWRRLGPAAVQGLRLRDTDLLLAAAPVFSESSFPEALQLADALLPLRYRFRPGAEDDGVTVSVPVEGLGQLDERQLQWHVPGMRQEKVLALLRALPKSIRRRLGPAPDAAAEFLERHMPDSDDGELAPAGSPSLVQALSTWLAHRFDVHLPDDLWTDEHLARILPEHLRVRIVVLGENGEQLTASRDLAALRERFDVRGDARGRDAAAKDAPGQPADEHRHWAFGELPRSERVARGDAEIWLYPTLLDTGHGVRRIDVDSAASAQRIAQAGLLRLFLLGARLNLDKLARRLPQALELFWLENLIEPHPLWSPDAEADPSLAVDALWLAARRAFGPDLERIRDEAAFAAALERGLQRFDTEVERAVTSVLEIGRRFKALKTALQADELPPAYRENVEDMREQLAWLVFRGFVRSLSEAELLALPRYLEAMQRRLDKLLQGGARDGEKLKSVRPLWERYLSRARAHRAQGREDAALNHYRWMMEEYRVSVFAQEQGTATRVSRQRLDRLWASIAA
ncbi:MAG: DUF3418 domain-containing protein, partial [Gammaproteobacteria bacterium]|nr:DUF3418 domain-containing protein [Gammaproteobacteria bacterium]